MKHYDIAKPIGLAAPCREIENTCRKAHLYKRCGLRPTHLIVPLDPGCGRTTLIEYMAGRYRQAGVLPGASGPDDYLEVVFDGTLQQLERTFSDIDAAAVYTNAYCGVVGMDISGIASRLGEKQYSEFMKRCKRVCEHACVVFFVRSVPSRNEERLLESLCQTVDNVKRLAVEPYTKDDICSLVAKAIAEHGVEIRHEGAFRAVLSDLVSELGVTSVRDAVAAAGALVRFADFSGFVPVVDEKSLRPIVARLHGCAERREMK